MNKLIALGIVVLTAPAVVGQIAPLQDKDGIYMLGKGLTQAKLVHGATAVYPSDPGLVGTKYICALRVVVGVNGLPGAILLMNERSSPFDDAAIAAVKQSQFEPAIYQGNPVPTRLMLWVPFLGRDGGVLPIVGTAEQMGVTAPVPLKLVQAEYPKEARKRKLHEIVLVRLLVSEKGLPLDASVVSPVGTEFDESALIAVEKYRFKPAMLYGIPVPKDIGVVVDFKP